MPKVNATPCTPALRRVALEACRAAGIACHAAAGLCRDSDLGLQTVRAARCAEGLMRSVTAIASAPAAAPTKATPGPSTEKKFMSKNGMTKDKDKGKDRDSMDVDVARPAQPRRRRRKQALRADAPTSVPPSELNDEWADEVASKSAQGIVPAVPPLYDLPVAGVRRPLVARLSSSRSPRRSSPAPTATTATAAAPGSLRAGCIALIEGLVSRPELDQSLVELTRLDANASRWVCRSKGGEQLRITPDKLKVILEDHQCFQRLRYEAT